LIGLFFKIASVKRKRAMAGMKIMLAGQPGGLNMPIMLEELHQKY
jgi:hypothetical protein